jgi:haloalkane dehalogenase
MAYYEVGQGDPIVFLHGNPTSSYLWRNIVPYVQHLGRCIAPDLIGMGDSDKLPDGGPGRYAFREQQDYLFEFLEQLNLGRAVTLVVHDWGSALGFTWAQANRDRIRGLAYMEAIVEPPDSPTPPDPPGSFFMRLRSPEGETLILSQNGFVERMIGGLSLYLSVEDAAEYRRPFATPGESRRAMLTLARELPLGGEPQAIYDVVRRYSDWLVTDTRIPKLFISAAPGALIARPETLAFLRTAKNQKEAAVYGPHWVQEVSANAIGRVLREWIASHGVSTVRQL